MFVDPVILIITYVCHGRNDLMLGYVSREPSLVIGKLELIKMFYLYKSTRIKDMNIRAVGLQICL